MGHLTGARTKREITQVEVVADDSQRVLRFRASESGSFSIEIRDATASEWSYESFATLDKDDATIVARVMSGGIIAYDAEFDRVKAIGDAHSLPKPEDVKGPMDGDCTPLDVERAKAENLREAKELVQLEMERDHALDRHVTGDVPGCPACDRRVIPSAMPDITNYNPETGTYDEV